MPVEAWLDLATKMGGYADTNLFASICRDKSLKFERIIDNEGSTSQSDVLESLSRSNMASSIKMIRQGNKLKETISKRFVGAVIHLSDSQDQNTARSLVGSVEWIALYCTGEWTMIPVENLIAVCANTGTKLALYVDKVENLPGVFYALDTGPDAVILPTNYELCEKYISLLSNREESYVNGSNFRVATSKKVELLASADIVLERAIITGITVGLVGDRVCVDLIRNLAAGEGLLVGSSSKLLCLVHGETYEGDFVPPRPFRVNAGPVHSYVLMADKSTKYLTELRAGDTVAVVSGAAGINTHVNCCIENHTCFCAGSSVTWRPITVGRCKIETRPMLLFEFMASTTNCRGTIFLQQAETVRFISPVECKNALSNSGAHDLAVHMDQSVINDIKMVGSMTPTWRPLPVTAAVVGDAIMVVSNESGTHVGKRINANVIET